MNNGLMIPEDMTKFGLNDKVVRERQRKRKNARERAREIGSAFDYPC